MIRASTFERADVALKEQDLTREPNGSPNNYVIERSGCKDSRTTGEEFRTMRRNSESIERTITVDEFGSLVIGDGARLSARFESARVRSLR